MSGELPKQTFKNIDQFQSVNGTYYSNVSSQEQIITSIICIADPIRIEAKKKRTGMPLKLQLKI